MRALALAAAVLVGASAPAALAAQTTPLEDVRLRGRILDHAGNPIANHDVRVVANPSAAQIGFTFAVFTLGFGLPCIVDLDDCFGDERWSARTDAAGRYDFLFPDAHEPGVETDTDYVLQVASPSGAAAEYELELIDAVHEAPDLRLWDPEVTVGERDGRTLVDFEPLPQGQVRTLFLDGEVGLAEGDTVDARLLEDVASEVVLLGAHDVTKARTIYHQRFTSRRVPWRGGHVPPSRGKPCTLTHEGGAPFGTGCVLTDGVMHGGAVHSERQCEEQRLIVVPTSTPCIPPVVQATVDLGAPIEVDLVVVRGCEDCVRETSADGQTWSPLARDGDAGGRPVRLVRLSDEPGRTRGAPGRVSEVSVWPAPPKGHPTGPPGPGGAVEPDGGGGGNGDGPIDRAGLVALAALLLGGVGVAVARRRRAS